MSGERKISRRSLFKAGAATAAGAAAANALDANAQAPPSVITASSLGTVVSVRADGSLEIHRDSNSRVVEIENPVAVAAQVGLALLDQPSGSTIVVQDPVEAETWKPNHEVVLIEEYTEGQWTLVDVQRLYRPIDAATITNRDGDTLVTDAGELRLTAASEPRSDEPEYAAVPLSEIKVGDVVGGIGYDDSDGQQLDVAQIGVRQVAT